MTIRRDKKAPIGGRARQLSPRRIDPDKADRMIPAAPLQPPSSEVMALLAKFRIIFQSTRQHYRTVESALGIGGAQLLALAVIAARPKIGITALADALLIRQPTASALGDSLVRLGLVRRTPSPLDRRAVELRVTPKGERLLVRAPTPILGLLTDALGALDPGARVRVGKSLDLVIDAMNVRDDGARYRLIADM